MVGRTRHRPGSQCAAIGFFPLPGGANSGRTIAQTPNRWLLAVHAHHLYRCSPGKTSAGATSRLVNGNNNCHRRTVSRRKGSDDIKVISYVFWIESKPSVSININALSVVRVGSTFPVSTQSKATSPRRGL
ncbi:protein of unknown function [Pseudomonas sp. JV241A]|nr:protein of unknown function [Pseudomonas sp. JV241A]